MGKDYKHRIEPGKEGEGERDRERESKRDRETEAETKREIELIYSISYIYKIFPCLHYFLLKYFSLHACFEIFSKMSLVQTFSKMLY